MFFCDSEFLHTHQTDYTDLYDCSILRYIDHYSQDRHSLLELDFLESYSLRVQCYLLWSNATIVKFQGYPMLFEGP